jgi:Invasion associated locus B (IalB) protein
VIASTAAIGCRVIFTGRSDYGTRMRRRQSAQLSPLVLVLILIPLVGQAAKSNKPDTAAPAAQATAAERLGAIDSWTAYAYQEKSGKVCYLTGEPRKSEPARGGRKHPLMMVTHRPGEKVANVVSFVKGYPLKEGSSVALDIGGAKFDLFTKGDSAWARTAELDKAIVEAMTKGKQAIVKGIPQKGQATTDTYSLAGFAQALSLIDKACDVKR